MSGIIDLLIYGEISQYYSPSGWSSVCLTGTDEYFSKAINAWYYENVAFKSYMDENRIETNKADLETIVKKGLKNNIQLYFVRLPISKDILKSENKYYPWFDKYFYNLSKNHSLIYINANDFFAYSKEGTDGSHLSRGEALKFSEKLGCILSKYISGSQK